MQKIFFIGRKFVLLLLLIKFYSYSGKTAKRKTGGSKVEKKPARKWSGSVMQHSNTLNLK